LEAAIAAQETLRGLVDDDVVDAAISALRQQLDRPATRAGGSSPSVRRPPRLHCDSETLTPRSSPRS
jgi:hypothetical protein